MDQHTRRDIRDMAREAKIQTQLLTQQGNEIYKITNKLFNVGAIR